ncbi:hypothetical protein NP233_g12843 [Leucocoprinus birnbaumii]|uniref:Uncharacterized protein n=1 Tax=Leucocoprinus birnbaumii TaxID=56174 RepID=A0AAD5VDP6_9AGAR|nr:hypothetical protein NP233_g12843 [Leucocoprinus birnbaumii]
MVIALLLSDAKKPLRYQDLGRVALQCLQGVHSMWKALAILHSALPSSRELKIPARAQCSDAAPSPRILSALDPHVADSGCQTRAQMLWDLVQIYSLPDKRYSLERAMAMLEEIRLEAAKLVREIEENRGKPRSTSLFTLNTHMSVWQRIGFAQFQELFSESEDDSSGASTPDSTSTNEAPSKAAPVTNSSHKRRNISVDADWDPENLFLVARFLTICFLLSEYRIAQVKPGTPMRVIFRVDLVAIE